jgi:hypothetical protein
LALSGLAQPQMGQAAAVSGYVVPQTSQMILLIITSNSGAKGFRASFLDDYIISFKIKQLQSCCFFWKFILQ